MSILVPERQPNRRAEEFALDLMPSEEGFSASFDEAMARNPTPTIGRWLERQQYEGYVDEFGIEQPAPTQSRILTPAEANAEYGIDGQLKFDVDTPEPVAKQLRKLKQEEIERREIMRRSESGLGTGLTAGLVATMLDPVNIASAFVPVVSPARAAALIGRFGNVGGRAIIGATEGAVGASMVEPIIYAGAQAEQADYDAVDSLMNVAFGTALGAGLHLGIYGLGRIGKSSAEPPSPSPLVLDKNEALQRASPLARAIDTMKREDQEAALRSAVAQVANNDPVNVTPVLGASSFDALKNTKVLDEMGKPLRVYHGTVSVFEDFDVSKLGHETQASSAKAGFFFTNDPDLANTYAHVDWDEVKYGSGFVGKLAKAIDVASGKVLGKVIDKVIPQKEPSPNVRPSYLDIQNPLVVDFKGAEYRERSYAEILEEAKAKGHDGVVLRNTIDDGFDDYGKAADVYVAFSPSQIKSYFDPELSKPTKAPDEIDLDGQAMTALASKQPGPPKELTDQITEVEREIGDLQSIMSDAVNEAQIKALDEIDQEGTMFEKAFNAAGACQIRNP